MNSDAMINNSDIWVRNVLQMATFNCISYIGEGIAENGVQ